MFHSFVANFVSFISAKYYLNWFSFHIVIMKVIGVNCFLKQCSIDQAVDVLIDGMSKSPVELISKVTSFCCVIEVIYHAHCVSLWHGGDCVSCRCLWCSLPSVSVYGALRLSVLRCPGECRWRLLALSLQQQPAIKR